MYFTILCLFFPLLGIPSTLYIATKRKKGKLFFLLPVCIYLFVLGLYFEPTIFSDLTRYFSNYMDVARGMNFFDYNNSFLGTEKLFVVQHTFFYVLSRFKTNQILPAITVFLVYFLGFYILSDYFKKIDTKKNVEFFCYLFFLIVVPFALVANNIRNILAVALIAVALYKDMFAKGNKLIIGLIYLIACLMHIGVVPFVLIRLFIIINNFSLKRLAVWLLFFAIFCGGLLLFIRTSFGTYFFEKMVFYLTAGSNSQSNVNAWFIAADNSLVLKINKYISILFSLFLLFFLMKSSRGHLYGISKNVVLFFTFTVLLIVGLGLFFPGTTWYRFFYLIYFFSPIFIYYVSVDGNLFEKLFVVFMVVWLIFWQYYQITHQSIFESDFIWGILSPITFLFR